MKIPTIREIRNTLETLDLNFHDVADKENNPRALGKQIVRYFEYRAKVLNDFVESHLMDLQEVRQVYETLYHRYRPSCPIPMNKQKGEKRTPAYLTGIVNMLIEANAEGIECDYNPMELTTVTRNGYPLRTLARRVDGAFPSCINPIAIWEIKEYYYTTTFGSRVADAVYESLLDGMELEELREHEGVHIRHYLMLDSHYTWWECGKPYLCRIIDALNMGYLDEVLFGTEVVETLPKIVEDWVHAVQTRN